MQGIHRHKQPPRFPHRGRETETNVMGLIDAAFGACTLVLAGMEDIFAFRSDTRVVVTMCKILFLELEYKFKVRNR